MLSHSNKPLTSTRESNESRKEEGKDREEETPWITSGRIGMAVRLIAIGFIDKWPNLEANRGAKRGDWQSIKMNSAPLSAFLFSCVSSYEWSKNSRKWEFAFPLLTYVDPPVGRSPPPHPTHKNCWKVNSKNSIMGTSFRLGSFISFSLFLIIMIFFF